MMQYLKINTTWIAAEASIDETPDINEKVEDLLC